MSQWTASWSWRRRPQAVHPPLVRQGGGILHRRHSGLGGIHGDCLVDPTPPPVLLPAGVDEASWLAAFLQARRTLLSDSPAERGSAGRVAIYQRLLQMGGFG